MNTQTLYKESLTKDDFDYSECEVIHLRTGENLSQKYYILFADVKKGYLKVLCKPKESLKVWIPEWQETIYCPFVIRKEVKAEDTKREIQKLSLADFQPGAIIVSKVTGRAAIVTDNYGDRATAVRTIDITNPSEWKIVKK